MRLQLGNQNSKWNCKSTKKPTQAGEMNRINSNKQEMDSVHLRDLFLIQTFKKNDL